MANSIRQLLDQAREFRDKLSRLYARLPSGTEREELKTLLDYIGLHEENLETCIAEYEDCISEDLDMFAHFTEFEDLEQRLMRDKLHNRPAIEYA